VGSSGERRMKKKGGRLGIELRENPEEEAAR